MINAHSPHTASTLAGRAPWLVRLTAFGMYLIKLYAVSHHDNENLDNLIVVRSARHVLDGISPYVEKRYLYPPSNVPFALLEAPFSDATLRRFVPYLIGIFLLIGWWAVLRLFDIPFGSWLGVVPIGVAAYTVPATNIAGLGSWTAPVVAAMGVALLLMHRGRWLAAGIVVGLSIAVKPMLMPIGLIFLLARRRDAFVAAAGIPVAICAVAMFSIPDPMLFFEKTVPFLLNGQDEYSKTSDASLPAMLPRFGVPAAAVTLIRVGVIASAVVAAVLRWRGKGEPRLRLVEASAVLMVGTFLVSTPAFDHYSLVVLPALIASVVLPGSAVRKPWFWVSLLPLMTFTQLPLVDHTYPVSYRPAYKPFVWLLITFAVLLAAAWKARRTEPDLDPTEVEPSDLIVAGPVPAGSPNR